MSAVLVCTRSPRRPPRHDGGVGRLAVAVAVAEQAQRHVGRIRLVPRIEHVTVGRARGPRPPLRRERAPGRAGPAPRVTNTTSAPDAVAAEATSTASVTTTSTPASPESAAAAAPRHPGAVWRARRQPRRQTTPRAPSRASASAAAGPAAPPNRPRHRGRRAGGRPLATQLARTRADSSMRPAAGGGFGVVVHGDAGSPGVGGDEGAQEVGRGRVRGAHAGDHNRRPRQGHAGRWSARRATARH